VIAYHFAGGINAAADWFYHPGGQYVQEIPAKTTFSSHFETVRVDEEYLVSRGQPVGERGSVLAVSTTLHDPSATTLAQLDNACSELDASWAARPVGLVLEDLGGVLPDRLAGRHLGVEGCPAIGLAVALSALHNRGLIHKDIKPANILAKLATRLTGFCSPTPREPQAPKPPQTISGTLAWMAFEQTVRMNRSMDSRADIYSCPATFYKALTGRVELRPLGGHRRDDGLGLPLDLDLARIDSMCLQLVHDRTDQLHDTVEVKQDLGTTFTITFDRAADGEIEP
jgi:hypothetical protein